MALRALRSLGVRCRLVKAIEIAQSACMGKHSTSDKYILLVPGGNARQKARALGSAGLEAIRAWVAAGGLYIGFCGGAGLALDEGEQSLKLCPLHRAVFEERFYHLLSGHVSARLADGRILAFPIWWPGRFEYNDGDPNISILTRYAAPGEDMWLADVPLRSVPRGLLDSWTQRKNLDSHFGFPANEPLVLSGKYGKGRYILSYAHPETPDSPDANRWLCELLQEYAGLEEKTFTIPTWNTCQKYSLYNLVQDYGCAELMDAHSKMRELCDIGIEHGLLFHRKDWLMGWQSGFSGMPCNNLMAALAYCLELVDKKFTLNLNPDFTTLFDKFIDKANSWLWLRKLDSALANVQLHAPEKRQTREQFEIFGHPMSGGGLVEDLLAYIEDCIWQIERFDK